MAIVLQAEGDFDRFEKALHRLAHFSFLGANQEIGEALVSATKRRFRDEKAPSGEKWQQSRRARLTGGQTLTQTRTLANSIHARATPAGVEVGTNDKRARTHQEGLTIRAKRAKALKFQIGDQWVMKRSVTIPKREFVGISDDDQRTIDQIIRERIEEAVG